MWSATLILLASFSITKGEEVFDVTTIYDVGNVDFEEDTSGTFITGRTHARTNALGLPVCVGEADCIDSEHSQLYNITCDTFTYHCNWDTKDWIWTPSVFEDMEEKKVYRLTENVTLEFKNMPNYNDENNLYFTSGESSIKNEVLFFLMRFWRHQSSGPSLYMGCKAIDRYCAQHGFDGKDRDGSRITVCCDSHYGQISFEYGNDLLSFYITKNNIKIYRGLSNPSLAVDWSITGAGYGDIKYFTITGDNFVYFRPSIAVRLLSATHEGSDMVSPAFSPDSSQLCLSFVVNSPQFTREDILHILAEDIYHIEHHLEAINNVKAGWNIKHINVTLQKNVSSPIKLIVRKVGTLPTEISRISSCNPEGEEVKQLTPITVSNSIMYRYSPDSSVHTAWSKMLDLSKNMISLTRDCKNGGVVTSAGCACAPGFSGQECQFGCGRNRFGQDCGGLCSLRLRECDGFKLCTRYTGCQCAPGYHGLNCNERCPSGWYGNDCGQKCGHCAYPGNCDIYTGECSSCAPGYRPPYCTQAYVYYSSTPQLSTPDYNKITVTLYTFAYSPASEKPELYQVQYREMGKEWRTYITKEMPEIFHSEGKSPVFDTTGDFFLGADNRMVSETIDGLQLGVLYQVRVLLMDAAFNKYDGELVKSAEILTKCDIPEEYDYKVTAVTEPTSFFFSWSYVNDTEFWCPLLSYEVSWKEGWLWSSLEISSHGIFSLQGFLPSSTIKFRVRAKTSGGFAPYSRTGVYSTKHKGTSAVRNLEMVSCTSSSVELSWEVPRFSEGRHLQYTITYKCVEQPACSPGCLNATEGHLTVDKTSVTLSHLLPFAQYRVTVTPQYGTEASIYVGTSKVAPTEVPVLSAQKPVRTNTSLSVFWDPTPVCSSFLLGYNYELVQVSPGLKLLDSGFTKDTSVSFHNLTASTEYIVKVYVLTVAGWNPESYLAIKTSTSATVPEAVRNLTVYKRGRSMLGVRWAAPRATYGALKSFTVQYELGQEQSSHTVEPTPCVAWPDLYCHTVEALKASRRYNITVTARNVDVADDGVGASVTGITKESFPSAPESLKLINSSSTSVGLQWSNPDLTNGVLRSFLISVEETEKYDQDSCCQVYPLKEAPVKEEAQTYETEVSGLHPASTYFVSVSAKTVGLGPSQPLVVHTRPPHLPFTVLPLDVQFVMFPSFTEQNLSWLAQEQLPEVNNSETYTSLIQAHLILAVLNETPMPRGTVESGIVDPQLNSLLQEMISKPFYYVSDYTEGGLVNLITSSEEIGSSWGQPPRLAPGRYQLVAVQVTKYYDVFNADLRYSTPFTLE